MGASVHAICSQCSHGRFAEAKFAQATMQQAVRNDSGPVDNYNSFHFSKPASNPGTVRPPFLYPPLDIHPLCTPAGAMHPATPLLYPRSVNTHYNDSGPPPYCPRPKKIFDVQ